MNIGAAQNGDLIPAAHSSTSTSTSLDQHQNNNTSNYSLQGPKSLPVSSATNMALNFSHDLLLQSGHHSQTSAHHNHQNHNHSHNHNQDNTNDNLDVKPQQISNSFDLDSGTLMQSAAAVGMWKNTMSLGHFKHHSIGEHSFLPSSDINSFSTWTHGNNMGQSTSQNMTHHLLDGQHLLAYPQHQHHHHQHHQHHQRSLPMTSSNQDLVGPAIKNEHTATSFMLNSINQQAVAASASHSAAPSSSHHTTTTTSSSSSSSMANNHQSHDNHLNIRSQPTLDHCTASYSLAMNDNQFYNNSSRAENRSHQSPIKAQQVLLSDRIQQSVQLSLGNHHASHVAYTNSNGGAGIDHLNPQPTSSASSSSHLNPHHNHNHLPGTSSSTSGAAGAGAGLNSSKNIGTFRCPHCSETFGMRNLYQSHLKTHSQDKGSKAKFSCELCGHSFSQKTSLNRHMKSHTGERPFPCDVCGKAFSEKERLKIHMRTHTGEKPFSCGICGKSFSQKSTVKRHQTVHTGEKKFKCDCGKGFANRGNLIAHIKTRGANHFE